MRISVKALPAPLLAVPGMTTSFLFALMGGLLLLGYSSCGVRLKVASRGYGWRMSRELVTAQIKRIGGFGCSSENLAH